MTQKKEQWMVTWDWASQALKQKKAAPRVLTQYTRIQQRERILPAILQHLCSIPNATVDVRMHLTTDACRQATHFLKIQICMGINCVECSMGPFFIAAANMDVLSNGMYSSDATTHSNSGTWTCYRMASIHPPRQAIATAAHGRVIE